MIGHIRTLGRAGRHHQLEQANMMRFLSALLERRSAQGGRPPRLVLERLKGGAGMTVIRGVPQQPAGPLLVIFGSILPSDATPEFIGVAARSRRPVLWIMEHQFDYYANPATVPDIIGTIRSEMARTGDDRIDTLGFSMGGYAALAYASILPVRHVLSFAPRFAADPALIRDPRVRPRLQALSGTLVFPSLDGLLDRIEGGAIVHGMRGPDRRHYPHFKPPAALAHWIVPPADHFVAGWVKTAGLLDPLAEAALSGDARGVARVLRRGGAVPAAQLRPPLGRVAAAGHWMRRHMGDPVGPQRPPGRKSGPRIGGASVAGGTDGGAAPDPVKAR